VTYASLGTHLRTDPIEHPDGVGNPRRDLWDRSAHR